MYLQIQPLLYRQFIVFAAEQSLYQLASNLLSVTSSQTQPDRRSTPDPNFCSAENVIDGHATFDENSAQNACSADFVPNPWFIFDMGSIFELHSVSMSIETLSEAFQSAFNKALRFILCFIRLIGWYLREGWLFTSLDRNSHRNRLWPWNDQPVLLCENVRLVGDQV